MKPASHSRAGHDRWLISYADLVTLLFALFTTLYAASTIDSQKLTPLADSMRDAFDARPVPTVASTPGKPTIVPPVEIVSRVAAFDGLKARLTRELDDAIQAQKLEITTDGRGLVISLPENATFPVGTADVTPGARALIARVATTVGTLPNLVRVEGHTDDTPIRTVRYGSNWELSTARASAVVAFLIEQQGIDPARLSAAGYGEFHPRAANTSPENRARNRRIDLVVLDAFAPSTAASLEYAGREIPKPESQSPKPKAHPSTIARGGLSDVEGQSPNPRGEGAR